MKQYALLLFMIAFTIHADAQLPAQIMADKDAEAMFTAAVKKELKIQYPIFRVMSYSDKAGQFYTVLTESRDSIGKKKDTFSFKIKALTFQKSNNKLAPVWDVADAVLKSKGEKAIWFWSRYSSIADVTGDGIADPILVYGTSGANHFEDGRVVIAVYHNKQKFFIRHQNGTLDFERKLQIDKAYYSLPAALQNAVMQQMKNMAKRMQALFPVDWEKAMAAKKTLIKN
jgi:hypothetical protein